MQKYTDITEDKTLRESRQLLLDNDMTALTNQAGESAPTSLQAGMTWYDSANKVLKIYNGTSWASISISADVNNKLSNKATLAEHNNLTASGNEFTFASSGLSGDVYINYRTAGGTNGNITNYKLGNGKGGTLGDIIHSGNIGSQSVNYAKSSGSVAWGNVSGRPSSLPASDVYSWAKASSKPSYSWSEISGKPTIPSGAYISESKYNSDGSWYRKWSDGFIEQGGLNKTATSGNKTVTLVKPFTTTNYAVFTSLEASTYLYCLPVNTKTTTTFNAYYYNIGRENPFAWYACGK